MRSKLFTLVLILSCFAYAPSSRAGFWVKSHTSGVSSPASLGKVAAFPVDTLVTWKQSKPKRMPLFQGSQHHGWEGITAFVLGILGIIVFFLGPFAILFGILGLRHDKEHKGLALVGLILGCITTLVYGYVVVGGLFL